MQSPIRNPDVVNAVQFKARGNRFVDSILHASANHGFCSSVIVDLLDELKRRIVVPILVVFHRDARKAEGTESFPSCANRNEPHSLNIEPARIYFLIDVGGAGRTNIMRPVLAQTTSSNLDRPSTTPVSSVHLSLRECVVVQVNRAIRALSRLIGEFGFGTANRYSCVGLSDG